MGPGPFPVLLDQDGLGVVGMGAHFQERQGVVRLVAPAGRTDEFRQVGCGVVDVLQCEGPGHPRRRVPRLVDRPEHFIRPELHVGHVEMPDQSVQHAGGPVLRRGQALQVKDKRVIGDRAALLLQELARHHPARPAQEVEPPVDLDEARLAEQPAEDGPRRLARVGARGARAAERLEQRRAGHGRLVEVRPDDRRQRVQRPEPRRDGPDEDVRPDRGRRIDVIDELAESAHRVVRAVAFGIQGHRFLAREQAQVREHAGLEGEQAEQGREWGERPLGDDHPHEVASGARLNEVGPGRGEWVARGLAPLPGFGDVGQRVLVQAEERLGIGAVPQPEVSLGVAGHHPLCVHQRAGLERLVRGMPVMLGQQAQQGIAADQPREPFVRLAAGPDRLVQGPHGRERLGIAESPQPLLDHRGQPGVAADGIRTALQSQLPQRRGKPGPRQDLGGLDEPG
jgi:hypothetical protein